METKSKFRWGELSEDEPPDLEFLLPPKQVIGPDERGIKRVIGFKLDDESRKVKVTTTTRIRKIRLNRRAIERRLTMVSTEEIVLERHQPLGGVPSEETKTNGDALGQKTGKGGGILMVCRICGKKGDHWTSRCPIKDLAPQVANETEDAPTISISSTSKKGTYIPPSMRNGGVRRPSDSSFKRNDENALRVGNLTKDAIEEDLHELLSPFGPIARAYVVKDIVTGLSRGFGFVNFYNREDAERALDKLNGYGYDNLILDVAWSKPI